MKIISIILFFALLGLLIPTNTIYAKSVQDTLTIQTIWVTGNKSCYFNDNARLMEYHNEIILKYLGLYGLYPYSYEPVCINELEYESYQPPDYTDVLIVIFNKNIGRDVLHANNKGGYFAYDDSGNKSELRIVVCECPSFKYNDSAWVISHELAHFALFYLGLPESEWADWVHNVQSRYYAYCPDGDTTSYLCNGLYLKIEGYTTNYKVMAINTEAYGKTPPQIKFVNYLSTDDSNNFNDNESIYTNPTDKVTVTSWYNRNLDDDSLENYSINNSLLIISNLKNNQDRPQSFAYVVAIKDENDVIVFMETEQGTLSAKETASTFVVWIPTKSGYYSVERHFWESVDSPTLISKSIITGLTVSEFSTEELVSRTFEAKAQYKFQLPELKSGIEISEKSLSSLKFENNEAQKKIDEARLVLDKASRSLKDAENTYDKAIFYLDNNNYRTSYNVFQSIDPKADSIEEDLIWISKAIEDAKKLEEASTETCFLIWCW